MLASELIKQLQALVDEYGDKNIIVNSICSGREEIAVGIYLMTEGFPNEEKGFKIY